MPVPGTRMPEPAPVDAVSATALPWPSMTEMWVVPRVTTAQEAASRGSVRLLPHHARKRVDCLGGAGLADAELLQQRQSVRDQHTAARRRRVGEELLAAEARPHRAAANDAIFREVALGEAASACAEVLDDRCAELPRVELGGAPVGEQLQRLREVVLDQRVAGDQRGAVLLVHGPRLRRVAQDQVEDAVQVRLPVVELDAIARELDRGLEEVTPRQASERLVRGLEPECGAGNRAGRGADVKALRRAAAEVDVDVFHQGELGVVAEARDRDEEVEDARTAVARTVDEHEAACAGAGERALRHPRHERGRDGGVDRVAASLQRPRARLRGQPMAACDCPSHGQRVNARVRSLKRGLGSS